MLEPNFSPFPELETERMHLRAATMADAPAVFEMRSDTKLLQYINKKPAETMEEAYAFIQLITDNWQNNVGISWCMAHKVTGEVMGTIALWRLVKEHYRAEIGYTLLKRYQGAGFMSEALAAVTAYGFDTMGLHTIEANINPANEASRAVLLKQGFVKEGYLREDFYYEGKFYDTEMYGLLRPRL